MRIFLEKTIDQISFAVQDAVEFQFDDDSEIGSSDISCCVMSVIRSLGYNPNEICLTEQKMIRNAVMNRI